MDGSPLDCHLLPYPGTFRQPPSSERPDFIEKIRAEARGEVYRPAARKKAQANSYPPDPEAPHALFTVCTGNRWIDLAEREPPAKMLFGELWHQNELSILFADTNTGKSVLAVQLAHNITLGKKTGPFACQAKPQRVLYIDFELTCTQFHQRYSSRDGNYDFNETFFRAQSNPVFDVPGNYKSYDDFLIAGIEYKVELVKATVLIIDNISCLRGGIENATVALKLMNNLKALKTDHKLSILVLAHTPKRRNPSRPISPDDLHGSKLLINFADSAFAIGKSNADKNLCYIKQIKQRNTQQLYGEDNVCLCRIVKPKNFLQFKFEGYGTEQEHTMSRAAAYRDLLVKKIAELAAQGLTQREISTQLHISLGTVNNLIRYDAFQDAGHQLNGVPPAAKDTKVSAAINKTGRKPAAKKPGDPPAKKSMLQKTSLRQPLSKEKKKTTSHGAVLKKGEDSNVVQPLAEAPA